MRLAFAFFFFFEVETFDCLRLREKVLRLAEFDWELSELWRLLLSTDCVTALFFLILGFKVCLRWLCYYEAILEIDFFWTDFWNLLKFS